MNTSDYRAPYLEQKISQSVGNTKYGGLKFYALPYRARGELLNFMFEHLVSCIARCTGPLSNFTIYYHYYYHKLISLKVSLWWFLSHEQNSYKSCKVMTKQCEDTNYYQTEWVPLLQASLGVVPLFCCLIPCFVLAPCCPWCRACAASGRIGPCGCHRCAP